MILKIRLNILLRIMFKMCVISIIENENMIPTKKTMQDMEKANNDGIGFGVFDNNKQAIYIKKGIELKELMRLTKEHKEKGNLQQIQHYRIKSHGSINDYNTQGFEIKNGSSNDLEYYTNNSILYHNGTISMDILNNMAIQIMTNHKDAIYPTNKDNSDISDTFLLSWILSYVDYSILNMFTGSNRFCIMDGMNGKISRFGTWDNIKDDNQNIVTSNDYFKHNYFNQSYSNLMDDYQLEYMTKDEEKELDRVSKKYDMDRNDIIHDYLDYGYSIFDIEYIIDNEEIYAKNEYLEYEKL